jgi:hypothetical protein
MNKIEQYNYNRIVIIGNGYDRALGMATSYQDFLLDYIKECIKSAMHTPYLEDPVISIGRIQYRNNAEMWNHIESMTEIKSLLEYCENRINISFKSEFFSLMLEKLEQGNWVDLESLYFNLLINKVEGIKKTNFLFRDYSEIIKLNSVFTSLKLALERYICKIDTSFNVDFPKSSLISLHSKFKDKLYNSKAYISHQKTDEEIGNPQKILFVNFNYTNSLKKIIYSTANHLNSHILNIHGQIQNEKNPIIFGYGDDTHIYYKELEIEDSPEPLKHIKSFHYPKTENYHTLLDFMSSDKFEVFIVGHSCGLSDRTLLKTIFEHKYCVAVKIFHKGTIEDHFLKNIAISRHFENKSELRRKILPYDEFAFIPQDLS